MFYSVTGQILFKDEGSVAVDCGGVGYLCLSSYNTTCRLGAVGSVVTLFTHLNVREGSMELFGFLDKRELECFKQLITVTGVGPRAGLAVLSHLTPDKLALCIATGDVKTITGAQGIGPKLAQRIVLELKDKLQTGFSDEVVTGDILSAGVASQAGASAEAISALVALGYSQSEASIAVSRLDSSLTTEELIKQALKAISKK
ncbi:MAG: Holliday junction branch migration protein RuvA [Acutalibacteraceae bacterium]|jgi:Holliday junction DNA helicase RuvA